SAKGIGAGTPRQYRAVIAAGATRRGDLPFDGRAAGAWLWARVPAAAAAGRQMEDRDVRPPQRIAFARRGKLSRFYVGLQPELGGRWKRSSPRQRTASAGKT